MRTLEKSRIHGRSTTLSRVSRSYFGVSPLAQKPAYFPAIDGMKKRDASFSDLMIVANETRNRHLDVELRVRKEDTDKKGHSFKIQLRRVVVRVTEGINYSVEKVDQLGRPRLGFLSCFEVPNTCAKTPLFPSRVEMHLPPVMVDHGGGRVWPFQDHRRLSDVTSRGSWREHARKKRLKIRKIKAKGMRN